MIFFFLVSIHLLKRKVKEKEYNMSILISAQFVFINSIPFRSLILDDM